MGVKLSYLAISDVASSLPRRCNETNGDVIASEAWQSHAISSAYEIAFELVYLAKTRQEDCEISSEA